jgi:cell wall-associated NlpC family hydrolase
MLNTQSLRPGDVLLYKPTSRFGQMIVFHTGGPCSHAELYVGEGLSLASRDGKGTGCYELRTADLGWVLRPTTPFSVEGARAWFNQTGHQPYGWYDLLAFCGYPVNGAGVVCSPYVVYLLRAGGVPVFKTIPPERIAPNDLLLSELLTDISEAVFAVPAAA